MIQDNRDASHEIHLLTMDALLAVLVSGRAVNVGGGRLLSFESDDVRSILDWYRRSPTKWAVSLNAGDTETIVDLVGTIPPTLSSQTTEGAAEARQVFRLVRIVAHRFAGLHAYGQSTEPPDTFTFTLTKDVTLFEGVNGSGKTSIANAIVWCLTGHLIRSQRPPEVGSLEFPCEVTRDDNTVSTHPMSAVTPMPHGGSNLPADGKPIPADAWVELTFVDGDGNQLPPIRREQTRKASGKIVEIAPDLGTIGIDPIAWRIATTMPALLPFLAVGSASQLGQAVARLTGLADLVDLAKHANKVSERIAKRTIKSLKTEAFGIAQRYIEAISDLSGAVGEYSDMGFEGNAPHIADHDARLRLETISCHFASMKATALASAREVLGDQFDPEDKRARDDLEQNVRPAIEQLLRHLSQLPAIARLSTLSIDAAEVATTVALLNQIDVEAAMLAELAASPDLARRAQLYARVSTWMHEHGHADDGVCPVCVSPLYSARDPVTGNAVRDHLSEAVRHHEVIARTIAEWSAHWCGRLLQELPTGITAEVRRDLPASPIELLRIGLIDELFATEAFRGALSALRPDTSALFDEHVASLPDFKDPAAHAFPATLAPVITPLQEMVTRTVRAMAFAEWRTTNIEALRVFLHAIRRGEDGTAGANRAIGRRLSALLSIVEGVAPLNKAIEYVRRLEAARADHATKRARIDVCGKAIAALELIAPLGDLAQAQVETLRTKLHKRSEFWRKAMFRNATDFAPDLTDTSMTADGVLKLMVGRQGVAAPAQHVSNASALRGALLGFFLAFREHVLATRGGLATLLLDDPQELLDNGNRERLARGLSQLAGTNAQLFVTSHDRKFARSLVAENRPNDAIEHLAVHPVNAVRPTLQVSPAIEEVDRKRQAFLDNPDVVTLAQDYAADLRVLLESRLGDLFDDVAHPAYAASTKALTLNPLMNKLRGLVAINANELFTNPVVKRFAGNPALADGAEPRRVLNESHHNKASITYTDVKAVEAEFSRLRSSIEEVHEQFRLYRWREPLVPVNTGRNRILHLRPIVTPTFTVPLCPDIAAFVGHAPDGGSQDVSSEQVEGSWFEGKSLYYVRDDTLGFVIPSGSVAIVEVEAYPGRDQNLVIARYSGQVLARRLVTSRGAIGVSLADQMPDPRARRPTLTFDESKLRLHRIVGAIFTDMPPPTGGNEAALVETAPELTQVTVAYRVREASAVPLVLPGQVILGGAELTPADLDRWEGRLAAVALDDGSSIFKRVGARLPGKLGHLRHFETIGRLGSSAVIATEVVEDGNNLPVMVSARRVIGVLYKNA